MGLPMSMFKRALRTWSELGAELFSRREIKGLFDTVGYQQGDKVEATHGWNAQFPGFHPAKIRHVYPDGMTFDLEFKATDRFGVPYEKHRAPRGDLKPSERNHIVMLMSPEPLITAAENYLEKTLIHLIKDGALAEEHDADELRAPALLAACT